MNKKIEAKINTLDNNRQIGLIILSICSFLALIAFITTLVIFNKWINIKTDAIGLNTLHDGLNFLISTIITAILLMFAFIGFSFYKEADKEKEKIYISLGIVSEEIEKTVESVEEVIEKPRKKKKKKEYIKKDEEIKIPAEEKDPFELTIDDINLDDYL